MACWLCRKQKASEEQQVRSVLIFGFDEMIQALKESPEFSTTIAIKQWHQCGKTITQWFRKHLAESAGAFLVVIKKRQIAELRHPHTLRGKHHYRGSVALDVYFQSFWKLLQSGNCAAQTGYRKYTALVKMQKCQRTQILVCKDNH